MQKNNITSLFEDVNLYEPKTFNLYTKVDSVYSKIKKEDLNKIYSYLGLLNNERLFTNCVWCEEKMPFVVKVRASNFEANDISLELGKSDEGNYVYLNFDNPVSESINIYNCSIKTYILVIDYYFFCTNDRSHEYFMRLFVYKDKESIGFTKVGQFPESASLGNYDSEKYKKVLRKIGDSYIDYKNSEKSFKRGLYVGAYDYLRRVYERMIRFYESKLPEVASSQANMNMESRIKRIKKFFDSKIQEHLYPLYSVLSAGVHIMTEEECKDNYLDLKTIIDIQLQKIISDEELNNQIEKSKATLDSLTKKYSKK